MKDKNLLLSLGMDPKSSPVQSNLKSFSKLFNLLRHLEIQKNDTPDKLDKIKTYNAEIISKDINDSKEENEND